MVSAVTAQAHFEDRDNDGLCLRGGDFLIMPDLLEQTLQFSGQFYFAVFR